MGDQMAASDLTEDVAEEPSNLDLIAYDGWVTDRTLLTNVAAE